MESAKLVEEIFSRLNIIIKTLKLNIIKLKLPSVNVAI